MMWWFTIKVMLSQHKVVFTYVTWDNYHSGKSWGHTKIKLSQTSLSSVSGYRQRHCYSILQSKECYKHHLTGASGYRWRQCYSILQSKECHQHHWPVQAATGRQCYSILQSKECHQHHWPVQVATGEDNATVYYSLKSVINITDQCKRLQVKTMLQYTTV